MHRQWDRGQTLPVLISAHRELKKWVQDPQILI